MVSNLWFIYVCFNVEFMFYMVNDDVEVQFVYICDDGLVRFFVSLYMERWVFFSQMVQSQIYFFLVSFGFWFNCDGDYWFREFYMFQNDWCIWVIQGVISGYVFQIDSSSDVVCVNFFDFFMFVSVYLNDMIEMFMCSFYGVQYGIIRVNYIGVNMEEGQVINKWVGSDFERQCREWFVIICVMFSWSVFIVVQDIVDCRYVNWGWQVINYCIQYCLNIFVFECRIIGYQDDFVVQNVLMQSIFDFCFSQFFIIQVFFYQFFRSFSCGFDQVLVLFVSQFNYVCWDIFVFEGYVLVSVVLVDSFYFYQVNNIGEMFFSINCQLQWNWVCVQMGFDLVNNFQEVCIYVVYFVNECNVWNFIFVCLMLYGFRLWLNIINCVVNYYCIIENMYGMFYFDCEVNVFWGVDDVDVMWFILFSYIRLECSSCSGSDGNIMFLFLFYLVYGCSVVMNFIDFMVYIGVEQNMFGSSGFIGVDVCIDIDVMVVCDGCCMSYLFFCLFFRCLI